MPTIPVRDLAKGGILRDIDATAAPLPAWSDGRNVCFRDGKTMRSPIWRRVMTGAGSTGGSPVRFCAAYTPDTGADQLLLVRDDQSLALYSSGNIIEVSETGFTAAAAVTTPWTACMLGNVLHINNQSRVPRSLLPGATNFTAMAGWDSTWRCRVLRQFNDTLIALNVTKGATNDPTMVKLSDITLYGSDPRSWDSTNPSTLAYENPLSQMDGPILDGKTLGTSFLFYTAGQCWTMSPGGVDLYSFRRVFADDGIICTNGIVEYGGLHFVFGRNDIYKTDGNTKVSIADGRVREYIYRTMNIKLADRFFAHYFPATNEIAFCFVSGDPSCAWVSPTGCNNAAVYNLTTDTWSFVDLPNVSAIALCNLNVGLAWNNCTGSGRSWSNMGGSWYDRIDLREKDIAAVCAPLSTVGSYSTIADNMVLAYDFCDHGRLGFPSDASVTAPSFALRTGIALDDPGSGSAPLNVDKEVQAVYPEITVSRALTVSINLGSQMTTSGAVVWEGVQTFDPINDYKIDSRANGRFLAIRFDFQPFADTSISGFDLQVISNGSR